MAKKCKKEIVQSENAPKAIGPYSAGVMSRHFLFTSGQIGLDPASGVIVAGGIEAETRQALTNLKAILEDAGTGLENVVKTTVFLRDINEFARMNEVYAQFFDGDYPARSAFQVAALPKGAAVEIEAVSLVPCEEDHDH
jgi:2-iminobutanoate/2-iminopropanoate deaminase